MYLNLRKFWKGSELLSTNGAGTGWGYQSKWRFFTIVVLCFFHHFIFEKLHIHTTMWFIFPMVTLLTKGVISFRSKNINWQNLLHFPRKLGVYDLWGLSMQLFHNFWCIQKWFNLWTPFMHHIPYSCPWAVFICVWIL